MKSLTASQIQEFHRRKRRKKAPYSLYKPAAFLIVFLFCLSLFFFFFYSAFDTDKTVSETENRALATRPKVTVSAIFGGSFMKDFETYYTDTFPFRDTFLAVNQKLSAFFTGTRSKDDVVLVEKQDKDDFAGQDITYDE